MRWPYRQREHIHDLETNAHCNQYLQRATNKYGIENITIEPIEFCNDYSILKTREQYWIDYYDSKNPKKGFNLVKMVEHNGTVGYKFTKKQRNNASKIVSKRMENKLERQKISNTVTQTVSKNPEAYGGNFIPKEFILYSPNNEKVTIYNLSEFCRNNNLHYPTMLKAYYGDIVEYKGWKCSLERRNLIKKHFKFISPDGKIVEIYGLRKFCLDNHLPYKTMGNIHRGIGALCRGWRKYYEDGTIIKRKGKEYKIQFPNGKIKIINNLKLFCKEQNIKLETLRKTKRNKQGYTIVDN